MLFYMSCLCLYFLKEAAYVTAEEKCWNTEDIKIRKDGFISCAERVIIVKGLETYTKYGKQTYSCVRKSWKINPILDCTGLRNNCSTKDVDILAIVKEYIEHCRGVVTVCIIFDCISAPVMNLMNSKTTHDLTRAQGSYFQAAQFSGMLRCSLFGDISKITYFPLDLSSEILVRNQNGSNILEFTKKSYYYYVTNDEYISGLLAFSTNVSQVEAMEITIYSEDLRNITLIVEGVILYQCRNSTYVQETNDQIRKLMSTLNEDKCGWFSKDLLSWTSTLVSSVLSLFLIVIYVIKCLSWKMFKETRSKTISTVEISSSYQGYSMIRRNVTVNNYETPHHYTEIQV